MSADMVTMLAALDGKVLTKRITRAADGEWIVEAYDHTTWFAVTERKINGLVDLGKLLASLETFSSVCVIRASPLPGIDRKRCRRLLYAMVDDQGREWPATLEPAARSWIGLDFDALATPEWNPDDLARRRQAILRDRHEPMPKGEDDGEDVDLAGDLDPEPIHPTRDWALVVRAAISTLPPEFHNGSAWWTMTSSAGIKPGVRLRLWFWLNRPVSDGEAKRWLEAAPVDRSLYSPAQVHYTAVPIFDPPGLDPVERRSGWFWQHVNTVVVPELPEPPPPPPPAPPVPSSASNDRRAQVYADAALKGIETATAGGRHATLISVAVRLYSLADAGLLDHAGVTHRLLSSSMVPLSAAEQRERGLSHGGRRSKNEEAIDWARARARVAPDLPEGFRS